MASASISSKHNVFFMITLHFFKSMIAFMFHVFSTVLWCSFVRPHGFGCDACFRTLERADRIDQFIQQEHDDQENARRQRCVVRIYIEHVHDILQNVVYEHTSKCKQLIAVTS